MPKEKISNFAYVLRKNERVIGVVTSTKESYRFILKPKTALYKSLKNKILTIKIK